MNPFAELFKEEISAWRKNCFYEKDRTFGYHFKAKLNQLSRHLSNQPSLMRVLT
jgi:hypothetical protein